MRATTLVIIMLFLISSMCFSSSGATPKREKIHAIKQKLITTSIAEKDERRRTIKLKNYATRKLSVTATFYNPDDPYQTDDTPSIMAWNHKWKKGDRVIAISRDLEKRGLGNGSIVNIQGLGEFVVRDRMNRRWTKRIDIAVSDGDNLYERKKRARKLGKKRMVIEWNVLQPLS